MKEDMIKTTGQVVDKLPNGVYNVRISGNHIVSAAVSGKLRKNPVRIMIGDRLILNYRLMIIRRGELYIVTNRKTPKGN